MTPLGHMLLAAAAMCALLPGVAAAAAKPNIVVIVSDDQDATSPISLEPTLKRLAHDGVSFSNSFVNFSECGPSRASFLTGQASHNDGVEGNNPPHGGYGNFRPTEGNSLPVWMQAAGYRTALIGKFINNYEDAAHHTHVPPGWDEWDVFNDLKGIYRYFDYTMNVNGQTVNYHHLPTDYSTDVLDHKAVDFINNNAGKAPLFMIVTPIAPHGSGQADDIKNTPVPPPRYAGRYNSIPFNPPENFDEADVSDKPAAIQALPLRDVNEMTRQYRTRRETILGIDDLIKDVVEALRAKGQLENTYIVVTSDNGFSQGSHRHVGKILLYEEANRVPLVIVGPGVPAHEARPQLVNNLDVTATILEWAGATPGRVQDGVSLVPVLQNADAKWRSAILLENRETKGIRTHGAIYITHLNTGEQEFYDLHADPAEMQNNMADRRAAILKAALTQLSTCAGATCWVADPVK